MKPKVAQPREKKMTVHKTTEIPQSRGSNIVWHRAGNLE